MSIADLRDQIPEYAKDIRLNLGALSTETILTDQQKYGTFLAAALATGNNIIISAIANEVEGNLDDAASNAAKSAAAIMAMNNVYYRAIHLMSAKEYGTLPAKLRMNAIGNPGVDKVDFELWSLTVSAINGCGMCLDAHEKELRKHGLTTEQIQAGLRIAAVIQAAASVIDGEAALH